MTINEAEKSINMTVREIEKDGQSFAYTSDFRNNRINASTKNNLITEIISIV